MALSSPPWLSRCPAARWTISRSGIARSGSAQRSGARQEARIRDQPPSSASSHGPGGSRSRPSAAPVSAGWLYSSRSVRARARCASRSTVSSQARARNPSSCAGSLTVLVACSTTAAPRLPPVAQTAPSSTACPSQSATARWAHLASRPLTSRSSRWGASSPLTCRSWADRRRIPAGSSAPGTSVSLMRNQPGSSWQERRRWAPSRRRVGWEPSRWWTPSSTIAPEGPSAPASSSARQPKSDTQPATGPGWRRISSTVALPNPGRRRSTLPISESRKVPGSRSSGPRRTHTGDRSWRSRALTNPPASTNSEGATKRMLPPAAASSTALGTMTGTDASGARSFAMNGMLPPRLPSVTDLPAKAITSVADSRISCHCLSTYSSYSPYLCGSLAGEALSRSDETVHSFVGVGSLTGGRREVDGEVADPRGPAHRGEQPACLPALTRADGLKRHRQRERLQHDAARVVGVELDRVEAGHAHPLVRLELDEALLLEHPQHLAQRRPAYAELLGERHL